VHEFVVAYSVVQKLYPMGGVPFFKIVQPGDKNRLCGDMKSLIISLAADSSYVWVCFVASLYFILESVSIIYG
jgi:hypothetical protein